MSFEQDNLKDFEAQKEAMIEREIESIIEQVKLLKCTYPSEISRVTLIPKERCISLIYKLFKENKIYRLRLHPEFVPVEMQRRLAQFWSYGIRGFEMFSKMTWIIPNPQIPLKYQYQGLPSEHFETDIAELEVVESEE